MSNNTPPGWFFNIVLTLLGSLASIIGMLIWSDLSEIKQDNKRMLTELAAMSEKIHSLERDNQKLMEKVFPLSVNHDEPIRERRKTPVLSEIILYKNPEEEDTPSKKKRPWVTS